MILTGDKILKEVESGKIHISPFVLGNINPNSYNYRLGTTIKEFSRLNSSGKPVFKTININSDGFVLNPGVMYLSSTYEEIGSSDYMISLIGKSSIGRLGLFLQLSANVGHTGTSHNWTLELYSTCGFIVYPKMIIGQVTFWMNDGVVNKYHGRYSSYNSPQESLLK